jgi:MFS family permease
MSAIRPLIPLLIAAGILLGGNGLQGTLIALRGAQEGFTPPLIGLMGTAYFGGFLLGCLAIGRIMKAVGHVRSFSALAAIASAGTLMLVLVIDPLMWSAIRFATGFCFAGLFTIMESWLNSGAPNEHRARVLALYRIVDIASVTGAQFLIPIFGAGGFTIFAVMSIMITLSLVPVSLGDRSNPTAPEDVKLDLGRVFRISPLGCIGCIAVGVTNSAFRTLSPVYAEEIGMSVADVVTFVSVGIIGGAVIQYPLGYLSDRWDRRMVLLVTTAGGAGHRDRARRAVGRRHRGELHAGLRLRLLRHAALFAVGGACQRPRRAGRVRAGQRGADAVLLLRRHRRALLRLLRHGALRSRSAVRLHRRGLRHIPRPHPLPHGRAIGRACRAARPLHRAAAHLDHLRPPDAPGRQ